MTQLESQRIDSGKVALNQQSLNVYDGLRVDRLTGIRFRDLAEHLVHTTAIDVNDAAPDFAGLPVTFLGLIVFETDVERHGFADLAQGGDRYVTIHVHFLQHMKQ